MGMNTASVQRLYVAYFNRPADPVSLAVYEAMLPADRVATQAELLVVAETYFSPSTEYTSNFDGKSNSQVVNQLYLNIFGREAEADGLISWATKLTDGSITVAELALQLSFSAQGTDAVVVDARIEAATTFTNGLDTAEEITGYSGDAAAAQGRAYLAQISGALPTTAEAITAQKDTAIAGVDASIEAAVDAGNAVSGSSFTLTTAQDSITGTAGNDAVQAVVIAAGATGTTIQAGDQLAMAGGVDTLNIAFSGDGGDTGGIGHTVSGVTATDLNKILLSNFDTNATGVTQIDTTLMSGLTTLGFTSSGANGDTNFSGIQALASGQMANGSADLTLTYGAAAVAGAADTQALTVTAASGGTFTANGVETIAVTTKTAASTLADITGSAVTKITVDGDKNLTVTAALTETTIDASALTGNLAITLGANAAHVVTGGSGDDVIDGVGTVASTDTIDGGLGTDTLKLTVGNATINGGATGELKSVTGFEVIDIASTNDAAKLDLADVSGVDTVVAAANQKTITITDGPDTTTETISLTLNGQTVTTAVVGTDTETASAAAIATAVDALSGFSASSALGVVTITATSGEVVEISNITESAATDNVYTIGDYSDVTIDSITDEAVDVYSGDLVTLLLKDASGTGDAMNVNLKTLAADKGFAHTIGDLNVSNTETLNLSASGMTAGVAKTLSALSGDAKLTTLNISGDSALVITDLGSDNSKLATITSTSTGNITISDSVATLAQTITTGVGNDSVTFDAGEFTAADVIDLGGNTASAAGVAGTDTLNITINATGTVDTPAALQVANVETINMTTVTAASVIDLTSVTGASTLAFSGAQNVTLSNLTTETVALGIAADEVTAGTYTLSLADATGASDAISLSVTDSANASTAATLVIGSAVETLNIDASIESANAESTTLTNTNMAAGSIVVTGGHSADTLALGTLNVASTSVDASAYSGILSMQAGAAATTITLKGGAVINDVTGGAGADTITVGTTTAAQNVDGGAGTDVLNLALGGTVVMTNVDNFETINASVGSETAAVITTASGKGVNDADATKFTLTGGNSLTTFTHGAVTPIGAAAGGEAAGLITYDMSAYTGATTAVSFGDQVLDTNMTVTGSAGADTVNALYDAAATIGGMTGVETFNITNDTGTFAIDMKNVDDVTKMTVAQTTTAGVTTLTDIDEGVAITLTSATTEDGLTVDLINKTATNNAQTITLTAIGAANNDVNLNLSDIETVTLVLAEGNAREADIDLSASAMTTVGAVSTLVVAAATVADLIALNADITTINASTSTASVKVLAGARGPGALTITGGTGDDQIAFENIADVLSGGEKTGDNDNLIVNYTAILGGINVDLSAADQIVSIDGGTNTAVQSGFESVDLSSFNGFGAVVVGSGEANTIVGTGVADNISGGAGADTITAGAGADTVAGGAGSDTFVVTTGITADTIADFTVNEDDADLDLSALNAAGGITAGETDTLITFVATTAPTDTLDSTTVTVATIDDDASDATTIEAANIILLHGGATTFANVGAAVDAFEASGGFTITHTSNIADDDTFVFAYENSTTGNVHIAVASFNAADNHSAGTATIADNLLDGTDLVILTGVTDVTTLDAADFDFI